MKIRVMAALAALLFAFVSTSAEARHRSHHRHHWTRAHHASQHHHRGVKQTRYDGGTIIGGRPAGCPHAYCGCGARKYLGIDDTRLNLAWNWTRYYHGAMQAAVWGHHVALIEQWTGPHTAVLIDFNSGGGLSRRHERSVAGARIVGGGMARL